MRCQQIFDGVASLIHNTAGFGESAIERGQFLANCIAHLAVRKPGEVVIVDRNAPRFFQLKSQRQFFTACLESVVHLRKHSGM